MTADTESPAPPDAVARSGRGLATDPTAEAGSGGLPEDAYHADSGTSVPSLNASIAKILIEKTPLHAWHAHPRLNPKYRSVESPEFDYGKAAHTVLLEQSEKSLVIIEADDWRTKAAKELRDKAYAERKTPLLLRQVRKVREMVDAAKAYIAESSISDVFDSGDAEYSIRWQEGDTHFRSRLDWLNGDRTIILDYKTTANAHPDAFLRSVVNFGYDIQEAFYRRAVKAHTGKDAHFVFLVQEKEPPYACSLVALDPAMQSVAERKVEWAITLWGNCMATGKWGGYSPRVAYLEPPAWYMARAEEWIAELETEGVQA